MKKLYALGIALLTISVTTHAQVIESGQRVLGGSLRFGGNINRLDTVSGGTSPKNNSFYVSVAPQLGKAIATNLVRGYRLQLGYGTASSKGNIAENKQQFYSAGAGMFYEKFFPVGRGFSFSAMAALDARYQNSSTSSYYNNVKLSKSATESIGISLAATPAFNYSVNQKWMLQLILSDFAAIDFSKNFHTTESGNNTFKQTSTNFGVNADVNALRPFSQLSFGFRYIF